MFLNDLAKTFLVYTCTQGISCCFSQTVFDAQTHTHPTRGVKDSYISQQFQLTCHPAGLPTQRKDHTHTHTCTHMCLWRKMQEQRQRCPHPSVSLEGSLWSLNNNRIGATLQLVFVSRLISTFCCKTIQKDITYDFQTFLCVRLTS